MNTRHLAFGCVVCVVLVACDERTDKKADTAKTVQFTSEQRACFERVNELKTTHIATMVTITTEALMARQLTMGLKIEERRMNEKICMAEVACYENHDPLFMDTLFEGCLDEMERSDD